MGLLTPLTRDWDTPEEDAAWGYLQTLPPTPNEYIVTTTSHPSLYGSGGIGSASKCPKCGGYRQHSWDNSWDHYLQAYVGHDSIHCVRCRYTETKQADGTYAPLTPFDETRLQERVNWWAD